MSSAMLMSASCSCVSAWPVGGSTRSIKWNASGTPALWQVWLSLAPFPPGSIVQFGLVQYIFFCLFIVKSCEWYPQIMNHSCQFCHPSFRILTRAKLYCKRVGGQAHYSLLIGQQNCPPAATFRPSFSSLPATISQQRLSTLCVKQSYVVTISCFHCPAVETHSLNEFTPSALLNSAEPQCLVETWLIISFFLSLSILDHMLAQTWENEANVMMFGFPRMLWKDVVMMAADVARNGFNVTHDLGKCHLWHCWCLKTLAPSTSLNAFCRLRRLKLLWSFPFLSIPS